MGGAAFDESRTFCSRLNDCSHTAGINGSSVTLGRQAAIIWSHFGLKLMQGDGGVGRRARLLKKGAEDDVASARWV